MGAVGYWLDEKLSRKELIHRAIECVKLEEETDRFKSKVLKAALVKDTIYAAVEMTDKQTGKIDVVAYVMMTHQIPEMQELIVRTESETVGPVKASCPVAILNMLTPPKNKYAENWRKRCRK